MIQEVNTSQNVKAASDLLVRADSKGISQQFCKPFGFEVMGRETELQPENQEGVLTTFHLARSLQWETGMSFIVPPGRKQLRTIALVFHCLSPESPVCTNFLHHSADVFSFIFK